ncbi:MAG: psp operon transcriptional activator [Gammaproteobacteria bacterium]|jgi:psp operon transcriptional activator
MSERHDRLIGESSSFLEALEHTSSVAALNKPILIIGERGTGKELIAERLHFLSARWDQEYIKTNCATFSEGLLESELFGHEAGAFTGANKRHIGRFERADNGSLFLDELASTSTAVQEKLLRIIEYGEFERLGGSSTLKIDIRLIAASNVDLPEMAAQGKFREDLLDRLAFDVITLPPLRYRKEDIVLLAEHFALNMCKELGWDFFPGFTRAAIEKLSDYRWPGNIRELKNVIERNIYKHKNREAPVDTILLDPFDSPFRINNAKTQDVISVDEPHVQEIQNSFPVDFKKVCAEYEIKLIKKALEHSRFNQRKAADLLGLSYHQLRAGIRKHSISQ